MTERTPPFDDGAGDDPVAAIDSAPADAICPACERPIGVVKGRFAGHTVDGRRCRMSWEPIDSVPKSSNTDTTERDLVGAPLDERPGWNEAIEHFLANHRGRGSGYSAQTKRQYRGHLLRMARWMSHRECDTPVAVTTVLAKQWRAHVQRGGSKARATASSYGKLCAARSFWDHLRGLLNSPPEDHRDLWRPPNRKRSVRHRRALPDDDMAKLLAWIIDTESTRDLRTAAVCVLAGCLGLRRESIFRLRRKDLQPDGRGAGRIMIISGKGGVDREIPVPRSVWLKLIEYRDASGPVTPGGATLSGDDQFIRSVHWHDDREDELTNPDTLLAIAKRGMRQAGVNPCTLHGLRGNAARRFYKACRDLRETAHFLGHAEVRTTESYLDAVTSDDLRPHVPGIEDDFLLGDDRR